MRVWRIHMKNDIATGYTKQDLWDFCQNEKLIGVGWAEIKTRVDSEDAIRQQAQIYPDPTPAIKAINAMRRMKLNDLNRHSLSLPFAIIELQRKLNFKKQRGYFYENK